MIDLKHLKKQTLSVARACARVRMDRLPLICLEIADIATTSAGNNRVTGVQVPQLSAD